MMSVMPDIYLDNNATTQPLPQVVEAVERSLRDGWANPSSVHRAGQRVRQQVELARSQVCSVIGCKERELIFTSGATEACNLAIRGLTALRGRRRTIITTPTEHSAVREPCERLADEGWRIVQLPVGLDGLIDTNDLQSALTEHGDDVALVTSHWANNETGVIQPMVQIAELCKAAGVPLHTDATQAIGKLPMNVGELPIDALSLSAHKFHGPKGVGALFLRGNRRLKAQQLGGPHERQRRGGTENVPSIVGMGVAAEAAGQWLTTDGPQKVEALRDRFEQAVLEAVGDSAVNGTGAPRLLNTTNIGFAPLESEAILIMLSERGLYASAGAACSSGSLEASPVLLAMGIDEPTAHGSLRFSLSRFTTADEIDRAIELVPRVIGKLRTSMPRV